MTEIPIRFVTELEQGMVVQCRDFLVQLAYCPPDEIPYKGTTLYNKRRNKWFCLVLDPDDLSVRNPGDLQLVCFDLVFVDSIKVFRLDRGDFQLTTEGQRFIGFSA